MPFPSFLIFLFATFFTFSAFGWSLYELPLRIGPTSPNGLFEFELSVEPKLSMSVENDHGDLSVNDYEPKKMLWTEREKSQLRPCLEHRQLLSVSPPAPHQCQTNRSLVLRKLALSAERTMPDLIQFNGRHKWLNAVNGKSPGPTLVVKDGSEVLIRIKNRLLLQSLTIHFHGQTMDNNWFLDGVAPLQQCPIAVRSDFELRFTAHSVGSHFYRGNFPAGHQSDGIVGAFVVLPKDGEQQQMHFQKDYVAMFQDWPLVPSWEQADQLEEGSAQFVRGVHGEFDGHPNTKVGTEDGTWAILINSKGWHSREDIRRKPHKLQWTTFRVDEGDKMRFRLIHAGFRHPLVVHIEQHQMEVIATDGNEVKPFRTDALIIYPGERFDVRVTALGHPRWPIHRMVVGLAEQFLAETEEPIYGLANLDYHWHGETADPNWDGGEKVDFLLNRCTARQCVLLGCPFRTENGTFAVFDGRKFKCHSIDELRNNGKLNNYPSGHGNDDDDEVIESHHILFDSDQKTVDGFRFKMPAAIGPFSTRNGAEIAEALRRDNCSHCESKSKRSGAPPCECFYHKRFPRGKTIKITFVNNDSLFGGANFGITNAFRRSLSVHLHGVRFEVLQIALPQMMRNGTVTIPRPGTAPKCVGKECKAAKKERKDKPTKVRKDTVLVPYGGHTVIRFYAENPGWWMAETNQYGRTSFAFAIGEDDQMPKAPKKHPSDCNSFDPGTDIYEKF
ncbi:hypothetical protein niasHS_003850 [Heterodera schachtii]|uniref:Plastocyanin-like domain-containing protein n=2 Tax=Heterodera TaxID=34509 RepID=A0ABD2K3D8_HETSC